MRYDVAPCRLLIWLAAALMGWAVVALVLLYAPQGIAVFAVAGVVLWRRGQRPVGRSAPSEVPAPRTEVTVSARRPTGRDVSRLVPTLG